MSEKNFVEQLREYRKKFVPSKKGYSQKFKTNDENSLWSLFLRVKTADKKGNPIKEIYYGNFLDYPHSYGEIADEKFDNFPIKGLLYTKYEYYINTRQKLIFSPKIWGETDLIKNFFVEQLKYKDFPNEKKVIKGKEVSIISIIKREYEKIVKTGIYAPFLVRKKVINNTENKDTEIKFVDISMNRLDNMVNNVNDMLEDLTVDEKNNLNFDYTNFQDYFSGKKSFVWKIKKNNEKRIEINVIKLKTAEISDYDKFVDEVPNLFDSMWQPDEQQQKNFIFNFLKFVGENYDMMDKIMKVAQKYGVIPEYDNNVEMEAEERNIVNFQEAMNELADDNISEIMDEEIDDFRFDNEDWESEDDLPY